MALGFSPIATSTIGGSPKLSIASQQPGGTIAQPIAGSAATSSIGVVVAGAKAGATAVGTKMSLLLNVLGSISSTVPKMTTFTTGFGLVISTGAVTVVPNAASPLFNLSTMTGLVGIATGFWATTYVAGVVAGMSVGSVGSGDRWVEITPITTPNWADVVTL